MEDPGLQNPVLSAEERMVVRHFEEAHSRDSIRRFIIPLPRKEDASLLGTTGSLAVKRFRSLECLLRFRGKFDAFIEDIDEYLQQAHAELIPSQNMSKPCHDVYYMYLPMHAVHKNTSSTTKLRVIVDASAKSTTGVSLNNQLLVGLTVHAPLIDVLLQFRQY